MNIFLSDFACLSADAALLDFYSIIHLPTIFSRLGSIHMALWEKEFQAMQTLNVLIYISLANNAIQQVIHCGIYL